MGRSNKKYSLSLHQQVHNKLTDMLRAGEGRSKNVDKANDDTKERIYSYNTFKTYKKHANYFVRWINENYPGCTTIKAARKHVNEFLKERSEQVNSNGDKLSSWTIQTEEAALNKLFGIDLSDPNRFQAPQRHREDIKRSRVKVDNDRHFSKTNNAELINFCKGTGCRRNVLVKLEGRDLWTRERMENTVRKLENEEHLSDGMMINLKNLQEALRTFPDQDAFLHHRKDKGGKFRYAPIIGPHKDEIIERIKNTSPNEKVWLHVSKAADVHGYRSDYANAVYKHYARDISSIPFDRINRGTGQPYQGEVYICRKDEAGKRLDKIAMEKTSKALGHNRICVIADSYLRGL